MEIHPPQQDLFWCQTHQLFHTLLFRKGNKYNKDEKYEKIKEASIYLAIIDQLQKLWSFLQVQIRQ